MFYVSNNLQGDVEPGDYVLIEDNWDDWFTYETTYQLYVFSPDGEGQWKSIGTVKIGQLNMAKGQRRAAIPEQFESLVGEFSRLGKGTITMRRLLSWL